MASNENNGKIKGLLPQENSSPKVDIKKESITQYNDVQTRPLDRERPQLLEILRQVVRSCTAPDSSKRPSASEINELLKSYL
ncbi:unnamed protein product [Oppiella nova]|uniref:Uncharacterized protein n=1 Tax=Oppiella nova TaxID=334625 RepID=A0A7R9LI20_9ACAR|nr:unnamed protein product [Oppiella nova]CAG2163168.1 unnamed protein product [Oppiella nova]